MLKNWIPLWAIPILVVFATGTVWLRLTIIRTTYAINQTDHEAESTRQAGELLQLKMSSLRSPRRLELLARTKFGLAQPRMEQVVYFKKLELGATDNR